MPNIGLIKSYASYRAQYTLSLVKYYRPTLTIYLIGANGTHLIMAINQPLLIKLEWLGCFRAHKIDYVKVHFIR